MNNNFETWEEIRKSFNFTEEEEEEMRIEREIIIATIEARKKSSLTQKQLSEKSGLAQPVIARIESRKRSPQISTILKMLLPTGHTLKVVPTSEIKNK